MSHLQTIYIAGPMTGLPECNYPAFHEAARRLRLLGYEVLNPAENPVPACGTWQGYMRLALAQLVFFLALQLPFTGGEDGLQGVPRGKLLGLLPLDNDRVMYFLVLAIFVAVFLGIVRIVHSPYGQVLKAIRENEARALSLGYDVDKYKLLAFVLSCALSGLAGVAGTALVFAFTLTRASGDATGEKRARDIERARYIALKHGTWEFDGYEMIRCRRAPTLRTRRASARAHRAGPGRQRR